MPPLIYDVPQGSEDWFRLRAGVPTASCFDQILAKGKNGAESLTRSRYMRTLAAERITGEPGEQFETDAMRRGKMMEADAREHYALMHDAELDLVGFVKNGIAGCSPDALLGENGIIEIKTKRGDILIEVLLKGDLPPEHVAQVQGSLWVTEREFCDFVAYWPGLPTFVKRCHRDETYIAKLAEEIARFDVEVAAIVERVRRYGEPQASLTEQLEASLVLEAAP
jgi:hypothetical protein